jgi:hypothetical protein
MDTNDLWLVCCDNPGNNFTVVYVELDNSNNVVDVGDSANQDAGTVYGYDIFKIGATMYIKALDDDTATHTTGISFYTSAAMGVPDQRDTTANIDRSSYGIIAGTDYYCIQEVGTKVYVLKYDPGVAVTLGDNEDGYEVDSLGRNWLAYDNSDNIYGRVKKTADAKRYRLSYAITADTLTVSTTEFNIVMMLDRNTASQEKGFNTNDNIVYQLHPTLPHQIHKIAEPDTGDVFVGITDTYLIDDDGDIWRYEDVTKAVVLCTIKRDDMGVPSGTIGLKKKYPIAEGMLISIKDTFTTAGSTSTEVIFEGYVESFKDGIVQTATLRSPAQELFNIWPNGEYSGRSDEIIVDLIEGYCKYITEGTLSNGGAMGTIEFLGDKTLFQVLHDLALFDNFIWYLTPTGALYYNNGTVDTTENFTQAANVAQVSRIPVKKPINTVVIRGGFVSGTQVTSDGSHVSQIDIDSKGINPYRRTHSHLDTNALCNTTATNVLARWDTQPEMVELTIYKPSVGLMQEGETITFEYTGNVTVASDQFGIREVIWDAKRKTGKYIISDQIV